MKKKIFKKIVIPAVCIALVVAVVALSTTTLKPAVVTYGVTDRTLSLSSAGEDITAQVTASDEPYLAAENEKLALYIDGTANITLLNKETGRKWSSQVPSASQGKFVDNAGNMQSICSLSYLASDGTVQVMDSFTHSVSKNQFKIIGIENGVALELLFGESAESNLIPFAVEKSRFEEKLLSKLEDDDVEFLKRLYTLYDAEALAETGQEDLLTTVPALKDKSFYIQNGKTGKVTLDKLKKIFEKLGYSYKDMQEDNEISGYKGNSLTPCFKFEMEFTLSGDKFQVNIPSKKIEFYRDFPLLEITPLKYFLSETGENGGYLIPSGSGAVSRFHNGALEGNYSAAFYGKDDTVTNSGQYADMEIADDNLSLGMYAMQTDKDYVMAVIKNGAEAARLDLSRQKESAVASLDFTVVQSDMSYLSDKKSLLMTAKQANSQDITVEYTFGVSDSESSVDYSLLANRYREYLTENGILKKNNTSLALILEYVGGVKYDEELLGLVTHKGLLELTRFDQIEEMTKPFTDLSEEGQLSIKLSGWSKGGLFGTVPGEFKTISSIGGKSGIKKLEKYLSSVSANVFYEANHAYYYDPQLLSGYDKGDSVRLIDSSVGMVYGYNSIDGIQDESKTGSYIVSPNNYKTVAEKYISKKPVGISVGRMASVLNSDYNQSKNVLREDAVKCVTEALAAYNKAGIPLLSNDCNQYAFDKVSIIENISYEPLVQSKLFDLDVPFKQMVLHGAVSYTGAPINSSPDRQYALLKAIETGSGAQYIFTAEADERLAGTDFSYLYYTNYTTDGGRALEEWKTLKAALEGLENFSIVSHESNKGLAKTVYENGTVIYVNYTDEDIKTEVGVIKAKDYLRAN